MKHSRGRRYPGTSSNSRSRNAQMTPDAARRKGKHALAAAVVAAATAWTCPVAAFVSVPNAPSPRWGAALRLEDASVNSRTSRRSRKRGTAMDERAFRRRTKRTWLPAASSPRPDGLNPKDLEWMPEGMRNCIMLPPKTVAELEEEERKAAIAWKDDGRNGRVLVRRREIPIPERDAIGVCQLVMESLRINDDPMLNYGAAVLIKHASSRNPMRNMTPKDLGAYLQHDPDLAMLIENSVCRPAERAKVSPDGTRVVQRVELEGSDTLQEAGWIKYGGSMERKANIYLIKENDCWMVDAIAFEPELEESKK